MEALMLGVSGLRGTVGGTLTPGIVMQLAAAYVVWLKQDHKPKNRVHYRVVFARDSRPSGTWVRDAAVSVLAASGVEVIDLDVVTTPGAAMMVQHLNADGGLVATASHNPIQWNGLKYLNCEGIALPPESTSRIKQLFSAEASDFARVEQMVPPTHNSQTHALHVKRILDRVDVLGISTKRYKVVLDSVNGAGCVATATMLNKLGCQLIHLNSTPNGWFPHEPEPTAHNLTSLVEEVRRQNASVGFAQDPDGDRLAIVDEHGNSIGEEYTLALCAQLILSKKPGVVVANLSTSRLMDDIAQRSNSRIVRTPVGEANIIQAMLREGAIIGGEGNGGVIDSRIVPGRDSLVGIAYVLQLMMTTGKSVGQLVAELPKYEIVRSKFECPREVADRAIAALKHYFSQEKVDTKDGIRIDWDNDRTWLHARPSNTEPIMRIIAEAPTRNAANARVNQVHAVIKKSFS